MIAPSIRITVTPPIVSFTVTNLVPDDMVYVTIDGKETYRAHANGYHITLDAAVDAEVFVRVRNGSVPIKTYEMSGRAYGQDVNIIRTPD